MDEKNPNVMSAAAIYFCKAYPIDRLAEYENWSTTRDAIVQTGVLYVHEDYVVRAGPGASDATVFEDFSTQWRDFCRDRLGFDDALSTVLGRPSQLV